MNKQYETPLIILASARKQSDTRKFLDRILKDLDHQLIDLLDHSIAPYDYSGNYPESDEFPKIAEQIINHKKIVFATTVYWYSMSGSMKIFFDRFTDLVTINKQQGRQLKDKTTFLIAVGADEKMPTGFELPFSLTSAYLDMNFIDSIYYSVNYPKSEEELDKQIKSFKEKLKETI